MTKTSAPAISRLIRKEGWGIAASRVKFGMHVSSTLNGTAVAISAQFDTHKKSVDEATLAASVLREHGYAVRQNEHRLTVEGRK